jgi:hypothetical protein
MRLNEAIVDTASSRVTNLARNRIEHRAQK